MKDYKNYYNGEFSDYDNTDPNYIIANQKYPTSVDDENISNETTYSSKKIEELVSISGFKTVFVDELPEFGENNTIYFIPCDLSGVTDYYDEYMWNETKGEWELIGNTRIDMSLYYTKQETDDIVSTISSITGSLSAATVGEIGRIDTVLSGKQDSFLCGENMEIKDGYLSALGYTYNRNAQSMSEGYNSSATGWASHAEGEDTTTDKWASHVEGVGTVATNDAEHAEGAYNVSNNGTIHSVGIGYKDNETQEINRKNAVEVLYNGNVYVHGVGGYWGETLENTSSLQDVLNSKSNTGHTHTAQEAHALSEDTFIPSKVSDLIDDVNIVCGDDVSSVSALSLYVETRIPIIDKTSDTGMTFDIEPNVMYMFGEKETLTINLVDGESDIVNDYTFQFESGNVATTLNVPNTVKWMKEPDIQSNKIYVVSIENNLGIIGEWSNE